MMQKTCYFFGHVFFMNSIHGFLFTTHDAFLNISTYQIKVRSDRKNGCPHELGAQFFFSAF